MSRRPVQPDDPPRTKCSYCGNRYNPYRHGHSSDNCPACDGEEL